MSLDGVVLKSICNELNQLILDGKIDKVYQPENDEVILNIRSKGSNIKLLMSASSNNPRVYVTDSSKSNPANPPMFCMLLRKHIQNGKIIDIEQISMERILKISIQSLNELGDLTTKELIIEIMGKHSNIVLVDKNSNKIIDSIKRVPLSLSSVRQVLPGLEYKLPPSQNKLCPTEINRNDFFNIINRDNKDFKVYKFLYNSFIGLSPLLAREICFISNIDVDKTINSLCDDEKEKLYLGFDKFYTDIKNNNYNPTIVKDSNNYEVISFSCVDLNQFGNLPKIHYDSISVVLEEFYLTRDKVDRIKQKSTDLRKSITTKLERALNKLSKQKQELIEAEKREKFKIYGDLLTANIYQIQKGQVEIDVQNFYSEDLETITIKLDPRLSGSDNAQKYYKKYNKLKSAYELISNQMIKTEEEINYLENILLSLENCIEVNELDEIREELVNEGYLKRSLNKNKKHIKKDTSEPYHFVSSDGYDIFVGKNNKQNDYLTLKFASKEDIWLHTKNIPGSHVIIKSQNKEVPENTIIEAAKLAAYYSKAKMSSNVPVDYTERKYVKKPNGAKPGMVIYDTNSTIYVTPSLDKISKIKKLK
ncbi:putative RNA-binding protein, snRNP like protein [Gottschalkia purinilytica]|uniref:Rqc2 homolog RqcH n=1 Tax=Gottschalkia purinilytica TaxID=1503 RepID=A0A0L0WB67_GOTPU|nr:NFACT RNA binding domain-containing protein [Gottschalkia purinilytica]KNF08731.1 putative RNA-binding protein, snRNP like protein [Gottschalkia purinilytica]